ncbi:MAG: rhomboid family intramembrane serine protease [Rhodobacteraceae bacterium]|nr:MAG: rhomboid family intramembrane serine protease [Paracoccaceae bacterium]
MFDPNADKSPFHEIPPVIVAFAVIVGGIEIMMQLSTRGYIGGEAGISWRVDAIRAFGFYDPIFEYMRETGTFNWETLGRMITYPFIHFAFTHAAFAVVMILAIGKAVAEVFHTVSVIILLVVCTIVGATVYGLVADTQYPLIGSYPAVYGLLGAFTWLLWLKAGATGESRLKAFQLIGFLAALQIFYRLAFGGGNEWAADLAGFAAGFLLSFVLAPDGRARIAGWVEVLRRR